MNNIITVAGTSAIVFVSMFMLYMQIQNRLTFKQRMDFNEKPDQPIKIAKMDTEDQSTTISDLSNGSAADILICECNSHEHQIIIQHDEEDNLIYCYIHLVKYGFFRRLKAGIKYIFGYKCRYGHWDEFIFKPEHAKKLRELLEKISATNI